MKITCPNCQKKYSIDRSRLPSIVKTAKCKACGQLIPLDSADSKPSIDQSAVIKIACHYCGKIYKLRQDKVPSDINSIQCSACGHPVPLKQKTGSAAVHSLKKETAALASEMSADTPRKPDAVLPDILALACAGCGKKYIIPHNKIPPQTTTVKCKVCGHKIIIQQTPAGAAVADRLQPKVQPVATSANKPNRIPAEKPPSIHRFHNKKRWFALAAGLLLLVVLGMLAGRHLVKIEWLNQLLPENSELATESSRLLDGEPILALNLNVPLMELAPTPGTVEIRYTPEPRLVAAVDVDRLKAEIPSLVRNCLFPGNYGDRGDNPVMTLEMDTVDIPNAALAEMTYEVRKIQSTGGKDVLRVEESKFKPRIQPGILFPGNIPLNIKKDTPPDALGKATIDFHLSLPTALEIFDFRMGDKKGSVKEVDGICVILGRLEKDVAQVGGSSAKSMRLLAFDQSGNALASKESMSTSSSASARFQGIIDTLKVVVIRDMLEYPFEVEVDLNEGKALALSREAEIPARIRYNHQPLPANIDFTPADAQDLKVTWREGREDAWNDSLSMMLPRGPFSGQAVWEVHFFGYNKPQFLTGSAARGFSEFSYTLDKGALNQVSAAFGQVQLNLHSDISRIIFLKQEGSRPAAQQLPSGDEVAVIFNENEITYSTGNAEVVQTAAYDDRGKRLKEDQYSRSRENKRMNYYWGQPVKFEIDVSTKTIKERIPFEIKQRPVDEEAYQACRQAIENQRDVVKTIKAIDRARRRDRSYYGDDLAGLYYLYDPKNKTPMALITQDVAQSDPAGQKRFGYTATPYKGYYFTVLAGIEENGVNKSYNRRLKKSSFAWQRGTVTTTCLTRHPDLVALPQDSSQPTFFLQWGQVFMKSLNGEKLEYLPDGYFNKGWVEAKFLESE